MTDFDPSCPLCRLAQQGEVKTRLYHQDELFILVNCLTCKCPMAVFHYHREWNEKEFVEILERCQKILPNRLLDFRRRSIPDHPHFHLR